MGVEHIYYFMLRSFACFLIGGPYLLGIVENMFYQLFGSQGVIMHPSHAEMHIAIDS